MNDDTSTFAILTDTTICTGCNQCVDACREVNKLPPDVPRRWYKGDGLSARNWTAIICTPGGEYVRKQCRHCLEPACVAACPVGALQNTEQGAVIYDQDLCIGCRYCMLACPYGIPRYQWDQPVPYIRKCTMCYPRIKEGKQPACTEACPEGATIFGNRRELLAEAKRRCQANPRLRLYGDSTEIGGTCVLYVSDIDLSFLSYGKELGSEPLPQTISGALHSTPYVFLAVGAALMGINWIIGRRVKLQELEHEAENPSSPPDADLKESASAEETQDSAGDEPRLAGEGHDE
jgi:formate dehydrogenase iron-sulfur subunit